VNILETDSNRIDEIVQSQRLFFKSGQSTEIKFRLSQLKVLKKLIKKNEIAIATALKEDLNKSFEESFLTEINIVYQEIDLHIKKFKHWSRKQSVATPWFMWPSSSYTEPMPLGNTLIIAPWNYPFQLLINPLVGAISSGCTAILKPSEYANSTAYLMDKLITEHFETNYIAVINGGIPTNTYLLNQKFDLIFFTGSTAVGKIVAQSAARFLTPTVLELGGKSPCVVDQSAHIEVAARRIAWGKTINAGQTCIAPDYILVHESVQKPLIEALKHSLVKFYGEDAKQSAFYPRMIHRRAVERMEVFLKEGKIAYGGTTNANERYVEPTLLTDILPDAKVMQEEIFGPVLPILTYRTIKDALEIIEQHEKPLAFYYFGNDKSAKTMLGQVTSGGACINDTIMHIANDHLPFGGVGHSGSGKYHGYESFKTFSHFRPVVSSPTYIDLPFRYPPFKYFGWLKKLL